MEHKHRNETANNFMGKSTQALYILQIYTYFLIGYTSMDAKTMLEFGLPSLARMNIRQL